MTGDDLGRIDRAMIGLRHLWSGPLHLQDRDMGRVEMSTVWIVNALAYSDGQEEQEEQEGMSIRDLASTLGVAHSTASRLVDRAVIAGAVARDPHEHDRRLTVVALTGRGRVLAESAIRFRTAYLAHITRTWSGDERSIFADLVTRFADEIIATPPLGLEEPR